MSLMAVGDICDHPLILSPTAGLRFRSRWPGELLTTTSRVPQLTCIWMAGASGLGNLTMYYMHEGLLLSNTPRASINVILLEV